MKMPVTLRSAHPREHEALCALFQELDELHHRVRPDIFRPPTSASRPQAFLEATIAGPQSTILVAADAQDQLLGLATLFVHTVAATIVRDARCFVELDNLVVAAQARRHGVGRLLVQGAIDWTRGKGIPALDLSVWAFNAQARAFYKALGFETATERLHLPLM